MLKQTAGFVLASLGGSTYRKGTPRPLALLRPRRTAFLSILRTQLPSRLHAPVSRRDYAIS